MYVAIACDATGPEFIVGTGETELQAKEDLKNAIIFDAERLVRQAIAKPPKGVKIEKFETMVLNTVSTWTLIALFDFTTAKAPPRKIDFELEEPDEYQRGPGDIH